MSRPSRVFLWIIIFYAIIYSHVHIKNIPKTFVVTLSLDMFSWTFFEIFQTFLLIKLQLYVIIIFTSPGVLNIFTKNIRLKFGGVVDNNMVSTIYHIASIGLKQFFLMNKVDPVLHQLPQTRLNKWFNRILLLSMECVIVALILGCVHKSMFS